MNPLKCNCHISFKMSPRLLTVPVSRKVYCISRYSSEVNKMKARQRSSRAHDTQTRMSRDVRSVLEGVQRGGSSSSAGPREEEASPFRMEGGPRKREDRSSKSRNAREKCLHERACTTTPPTRTHSALGGYASRDQYPRRRPWRLEPRVSLVSSVCDPAYISLAHTYMS